MTRDYILNQLIESWGVSKTIQIALLALSAASVVVVIGANTIPNEPKTIEKENK